MGNLVCCQKSKNKRKIVVLLLGLDNAGKTVAAKGLAGEPHNGVVPTVGFSVINLRYMGYKVVVYDLGGGSDIRGIWTKYFVDAHGVIFVVDSSDYSRLTEAKSVLNDLLSHEKISGKPLLLLANKQDHEMALDEVEIIEELDVENIVNSCKCPTLVQSCSASDSGNLKLDPQIKKGYDWLLSYIDRHYGKLNERVSVDVKEQEQRDKQEMEEKIARIKNMQLLEKQRKDMEEGIESYSEYARKLDQETQTTDNKFDSIDISSESSGKVSVIVSRPKSAREIVKDQLQLKDLSKKSTFKRTNKTAPANILGARQIRSAGDRRANSLIHRSLKSAENHRNFRSAGDPLTLDITELPNMVGPGGDDYSTNSKPYLSLKNDNVPWLHKTINGDSGISVIEID